MRRNDPKRVSQGRKAGSQSSLKCPVADARRIQKEFHRQWNFRGLATEKAAGVSPDEGYAKVSFREPTRAVREAARQQILTRGEKEPRNDPNNG